MEIHLITFRVEVEHLHDQLRELKDENGRLFKLVSEKDFEIKHLKKKREEGRLLLTCMIPKLVASPAVICSNK